ncbi:MAG: 30S ribosomal protein S8 [Bacteroidia bacterium]|nr:30S ribosomal protein S8 [Bacteroidia bacterium]
MYTDPIADYLTRIRNALLARHRFVSIPASKIKLGITKVLMDSGYILNYKYVPDPVRKQGEIKIALKYDKVTKAPAISKIVRVSRPGLRRYTSCKDIPRVLNGLGIAVLSTSQGIISGKKARQLNLGGEILCYVY